MKNLDIDKMKGGNEEEFLLSFFINNLRTQHNIQYEKEL